MAYNALESMRLSNKEKYGKDLGPKQPAANYEKDACDLKSAALRFLHERCEDLRFDEEMALQEVERALSEDVHVTLDNLRSHRQLLANTAEAVDMADEVFELTAENYANGLCDINTYSLAQNRRDEAYNQHLSALAGYWTTYYHLLTLTQHE